MEKVFLRVVVTAAVLSLPMAVCLFPARRWLEERYAPRLRWGLWRYLAQFLLVGAVVFSLTGFFQVWTVAVPNRTVKLSVPVTAAAPRPVQTQAAGHQAVAAPAAPEKVPEGLTEAETGSTTVPTAPAAPVAREVRVSLLGLLTWMWLAAALAILVFQLLRYALARRRMMRASFPWSKPDERIGFRRVRTRVLPGLRSPMTVGWLRPVIFLPEGEISPMALRHERCHIENGDLGGKVSFLLACAFYWFDPLVWYMAGVATRDMEAACDARVVRDFTPAEKRSYGELLLSAAGAGKAPPLSTRFGGGKEQMRFRLTQLFRPGRSGGALLMALAAAACLCVGLVGCEGQAGTVPDGTVYAHYPFSDQPEESGFSGIVLRLTEYDTETFVAGELLETVTLPVAEDVILRGEPIGADGEKELADFLMGGSLYSTPHVIRAEVKDGKIIGMDWVPSGGKGPGADKEPIKVTIINPGAKELWTATREAYQKVLLDFMNEGILPDGSPASGEEPFSDDLSQHQFAVLDVNGDGDEELIFLYQGRMMAEMAGYVVGYDAQAGTTRVLLTEFPDLTFYSHGVVTAGWSHNQGAGVMWPFEIYIWNAETMTYDHAGSVDSWNKSLKAEGFPEEADTSNTGVVYFVGKDAPDYSVPLDVTAYNEWLGYYLEGVNTECLDPEFEPLTRQNVKGLTAAG